MTIRDEANALVAYAFHNGPLEELHAGEYNGEFLSDTSLSRFTDEEMKTVMLYACRAMENALLLKEQDPEKYRKFLTAYARMYCGQWER